MAAASLPEKTRAPAGMGRETDDSSMLGIEKTDLAGTAFFINAKAWIALNRKA